jgi:hypothetical protein
LNGSAWKLLSSCLILIVFMSFGVTGFTADGSDIVRPVPRELPFKHNHEIIRQVGTGDDLQYKFNIACDTQEVLPLASKKWHGQSYTTALVIPVIRGYQIKRSDYLYGKAPVPHSVAVSEDDTTHHVEYFETGGAVVYPTPDIEVMLQTLAYTDKFCQIKVREIADTISKFVRESL